MKELPRTVAELDAQWEEFYRERPNLRLTDPDVRVMLAWSNTGNVATRTLIAKAIEHGAQPLLLAAVREFGLTEVESVLASLEAEEGAVSRWSLARARMILGELPPAFS
jgi:hypothetical protein